MADELLQWVDENDNPIGSVTRADSKSSGKRYRIVRIIVNDEHGNTLIQKRVATKDTYPNCWDNAAAGHVDYEEKYYDAAVRELAEEISLKDVALEEVDYYYSETISPNGKTMNRFTKIYVASVPHDTQFVTQATEVSEVKWVNEDELAAIVADTTQISDGLRQTYDRYFKDRTHGRH